MTDEENIILFIRLEVARLRKELARAASQLPVDRKEVSPGIFAESHNENWSRGGEWLNGYMIVPPGGYQYDSDLLDD